MYSVYGQSQSHRYLQIMNKYRQHETIIMIIIRVEPPTVNPLNKGHNLSIKDAS